MIEIRRSKVYRGPNVWARVPVVHLVVDIGDLEARPTNAIPGFMERLLELIPTLHGHRCSRGHAGGFVECLREGTCLSHVLEHVAIELQALTGADVSRGKTRGATERGVYDVIYQYRQEEVGTAAGELACRLLNHLLHASEPELDYALELENLVRLAERLAYGPSTAAIVEAAERNGIPVLRLDPRRSLVQLGHGCYQQRIWATVTSKTSDIGDAIAGDKAVTNGLLQDAGLPSPRGELVRDADDAVAAARRMGFPVVLKPLDGNHGRGVCIGITTEEEVRACFTTASEASREGTVLVEQYVTGKDYRLLVIANRVVAVAERVPAHVIGDGEHTVRELVAITNADPRRGIGHEKTLTRIPLNRQTDETLSRQSLTLDDIPAAGQHVHLQQTGNMSTGGTSIDRTDEVHPDNVEIARQAAMVVGLDVAGIDFIMPDITRSVRETGGAIVEVNAGPGFRMHTHPTEGYPRHAGRAVIDMLFPPGSPARVPIVAVTGTNGKTTTTRMIAAIMRAAGNQVGMTTTDGIYVNTTQIASGDMAGPDSARMILKNPVIDFAVLETARGGIVRSGLGFDRCDVAVVTNISSDHLGLGGVETIEDLARIKGVVPEAVFRDGASVLNADNAWTVRLAERARGEIIYFSMDPENRVIRDHLRERGRAVVLQQTRAGEMITLLDGKEETSLLRACEIPATMEGRIRVNIANALAATAAAVARDVQVECIRDALRAFTTDFGQTPGRFNLLEIKGRQVVMDYGHNVGALEAIGDFVQRTQAVHRVGVIAVPGDRRNEDARAFARLAGQIFDEIIVREDANLRGRAPREMAALLREAVQESGVPPARIHTVLDEIDAIHTALDLAAPGDLVVALVEQVTPAWEALRARQAAEGAGVALVEANAPAMTPRRTPEPVMHAYPG
ncbi:MAG: cyanophycin synthetase [Chloroflexota bacterium]|nr:cyanophycin synthetase [Chloroflexota bacterium]